VKSAVAVRRERTPVSSDAVKRAQAGDPDAFETVYHEHAGRVYALCLRMSGDPVRARELLQDVFVRAWVKLGSYRGDAAFGTWLHRLAVNVVLLAWRAEGRRGLEQLDENAGAPGHGGSGAPGAAEPETRIDLESAIAKLPAGCRQVLVLHDIEGYEHAEIGRLMGIAEGTSKAHLFRARRLLREALGGLDR
jgi:RNA polymerase sigma-70 factor (ECF subfamily)